MPVESRVLSPKVRIVEVDEAYAGQRIDNFLLRELKGAPRSLIYRLLRKGEVRVNKGRIKAQYKLVAGDLVRIPPVRLEQREAVPASDWLRRDIDAAIIFEDKRLIVLNKPAGIAVHGGSGISNGVIEAMRALRPEERQLELVHRLDRDTSGCLLIAKKRSALRALHELQRDGGIDKRYLALVAGRPKKRRFEVKLALRKNTLKSGERVVRVDAEGKSAKTLFSLRETFDGFSLLEARLLTGRTHQIRVHLQSVGLPLVGDPKYGDDALNSRVAKQGFKRMFLHAERLRFRLPGDSDDMRIEAPLDAACAGLLARLRSANQT